MPEQLQKILDRIVEWWKKFNNKQRAILISITAVVIMSLAILGYVISRPTYVTVYMAEDMSEANDVNTLLNDNDITYTTTDNGMTFMVDSKQEAEACYLLAENDYPSESYSIDNVTSGGLSTTEADKQKKYKDYLEKKFADHLTQFDFVKSANVDITLPDNDGTILASQEEGTAAVQLDLKYDISSDQAFGIALFVATELGNSGTEGVTVIDQSTGTVLYSGADEGTAYGVASTQLTNTQKMSANIKDEVKDALMTTGLFSNIEVAMKLKVDYSDTTTATHEYYGNTDGSNTNMIKENKTYAAESNGGSEAIPGTDSNDDTTYYIDNDGNVYYTVEDDDILYENNEKVVTETKTGGVIDYENSSISVVATQYVTYDEATLKSSGELDDMTFDEFKAAHSTPVAITVDDSMISAVATATGISSSNITFLCYQQPVFVEKESGVRSWSDILQIVLAVLIFALLGFVVFKSTRRNNETENEPELSVETLLESTAEEQSVLDDIGYSEKSETRILIEKFVDENPEAVALLLRNWLNEDWE